MWLWFCMPRSKFLTISWVLGLWWASLALAQNETEAQPTLVGVHGFIRQAACSLKPGLDPENSPMVVNLPALQTTLLNDTPLSPIALVPMRFVLSNTILACLAQMVDSPGNLIVFDTALAGVVSSNGLLRNSAVVRPAQNVLVQLGLVGADGVFTPLDLTRPQTLNASLQVRPQSPNTPLSLNLGVRYAAARFVSESYASLAALNPGASDVTPGNVSVFLPLLVNLK
jgi:hypothetical protein